MWAHSLPKRRMKTFGNCLQRSVHCSTHSAAAALLRVQMLLERLNQGCCRETSAPHVTMVASCYNATAATMGERPTTVHSLSPPHLLSHAALPHHHRLTVCLPPTLALCPFYASPSVRHCHCLAHSPPVASVCAGQLPSRVPMPTGTQGGNPPGRLVLPSVCSASEDV